MYIDSANKEDIRELYQTGIFDGVTTNPTILKRCGMNRVETICELLDHTEAQCIFFQVIGEQYAEFYEDYKMILSISKDPRIGIKVPITHEGLKLVRTIKQEEATRKILGTAVYSTDQCVLAAKAGCDFVAPYINRMFNNSVDAYNVIKKSRTIYDSADMKCHIMGASFSNSAQIVDSLASGCHTVTISPQMYYVMAEKILAVEATKTFNYDACVDCVVSKSYGLD